MSGRRFRADDPDRRQWQDPEQILAAIGLRKGMIFVDVGCGEGFFALPAARIVGPEGRVFAIDSNADAIAMLRTHAEAEGLTHLSPIVQDAETAVVCAGCADIVFFGIDLHDFRDPARVIQNARSMLKSSGRLVDLDWKDIPMAFGPPLERRFSVARARSLIEAAGFRIQSVQDAGPYHYRIIAGM